MSQPEQCEVVHLECAAAQCHSSAQHVLGGTREQRGLIGQRVTPSVRMRRLQRPAALGVHVQIGVLESAGQTGMGERTIQRRYRDINTKKNPVNIKW